MRATYHHDLPPGGIKALGWGEAAATVALKKIRWMADEYPPIHTKEWTEDGVFPGCRAVIYTDGREVLATLADRDECRATPPTVWGMVGDITDTLKMQGTVYAIAILMTNGDRVVYVVNLGVNVTICSIEPTGCFLNHASQDQIGLGYWDNHLQTYIPAGPYQEVCPPAFRDWDKLEKGGRP